MNKLSTLFLLFVALFALSACDSDSVGELPDNMQEISYEEDVKPLIEEDPSATRKVRGSCNDIPESSLCIDHIGSMWDMNDMAKLSCEGAGTFSENACPYSEFGGCQTAPGTITESIVWHYPEGGGGYDAENIPYAIAACEATGMATWVMPEDL